MDWTLSPTATPKDQARAPIQSTYTQQERASNVGSIHATTRSSRGRLSDWPIIAPESGQNAISTLLQPPIIQTGLLPTSSTSYKAPSSRDIPPVTLTNIAQVDAAEFQPYLARVGILYEQLRSIDVDDGGRARDAFGRGYSESDEFATAFHESRLRPGQRPFLNKKSSISSISSFSEAPLTTRGTGVASTKRLAQAPSPLSTIPLVYFDEDFHLENPRIFDVVTERSEITRPEPSRVNAKSLAGEDTTPPRKALATNAILQEKLSWYMDTVEMHLIASSSAASEIFFTVLGSLQGLHAEAIESVERIKGLRKELKSLDETIVTSGLTVVQKRQRRENIQQLQDAVSQLKHIMGCIASCASFVNDGKLENALESIDYLERVIAGEQDVLKAPLSGDVRDVRLRDLRDVAALQGFGDDLSTLRLQVGRAYEARFTSLLLGDLRRHSETVPAREVLTRWSSASIRSRGGQAPDCQAFPSYMSSTDGLQSELFETLTGLHRAGHLTVAAATYKQAALKELRSLVRRPLPSSNDDDNESMSSVVSGHKQLPQQQKASILARNLRSLEPEDAEAMLMKIYISVTEMLRRLTTQVKLLLDVASSMGGDSVSSSSESTGAKVLSTGSAAGQTSIGALEMQEIHKAIDLSNLLGEAVDVAQDKIVKLLRVRSEQSTGLSLRWFLRYFTLNLYFANECESISGRSGAVLKTVVNSQIKAFIQQHASAEKQRLAETMETDKWEAKDFSSKHTEELQRIMSSSLKDPSEWLDGLKIWIPHLDNETFSHLPTEPQHGSDGKAKARGASVDEEVFLLPNSAILCMDGISQYLQLIVGIPSMTSDIAISLVSYIQLFNARCEQLILGAEARRSADLKNITSKHLVLAAQALAFIATIVSYARESIRRYTGTGTPDSVIMELDNVGILCQEHQNNIYNKLVNIMAGLAAAHTKVVKGVDWDKSREDVHPYMASLVKDTTSLHRILSKNLPDRTVHILMARVFLSYKDQFGKVFEEIHLGTESGRQSMLRDVEFFESRLGKIDGCGATGESLITVINSKQIKDAASIASAASEGELGTAEFSTGTAEK